MPPVAIGVAAAAASIGTEAAVSGLVIAGVTIGTTAATIIGSVVGLGVSLLGSMLLSQKPPGSSTGSTSGVPRTLSLRQSVGPRRILLGVQRIGGVITFIALSDDKATMHIVVTLAGHQVAHIGSMYIGDLQAVDDDGNAVSNDVLDYRNLITVEKKLGAPGEPAFPGLVAAGVGWTEAHRQDGCAAVHVALSFDPTAFAGFDPSAISFQVFGANQIFDPRTGTTGFTDNAALCNAWYLAEKTIGIGADFATEIDSDALIAAANLADEYVDLVATSADANIDEATALVSMGETMQPVGVDGLPSGLWAPLLGDQVVLAGSGSGAGGITYGTTYYWIPVSEVIGQPDLPADAGAKDALRGYVAATLADALNRNRIVVGGSGTITGVTLTRLAERRYCCNGGFTLDQTPNDILTSLLTSLGGTAGKAIWTGGQWVIIGGGYRAPDPAVPSLDEDDLRKDGFNVQSLASHQAFCNGVRGKFLNPAANWMEDDYPAAQDPDIVAADGEEAWTSLNLPMELSATRAQRIAWMELRRARLELQIAQLPAKLTALRLRAGDTAQFSYARYGWNNFLFEVTALNLVRDSDANQMPVLGVDLALRLTDPSAYAWDPSQAQHVQVGPKSNLPDPRLVAPPGVPVVVSSLYPTVDGQSLKQQALVTWSTGGEPHLGGTHLEYSPAGLNQWQVLGPIRPASGTTASVTLLDVAPGAYDFRVQNQNSSGALSAYVTLLGVVIDLTTLVPSSPTNFTVTALSGFAVLRFDPSPDIQVRIGGYGRVRWTPGSIATAQWQNALDLGPKIPPLSTQETLELGAGTYMMKWVSYDGIESATAAMFSAAGAASLVTLANSITVTENPSFSGTKTNCILDNATNQLKLVGSENIDSVTPSFDAIPDVDSLGGIVASGSYLFASGIDLGSVKPVRVAASVTLTVVNVLDDLDARSANVDDWDDWDGTAAAAAGVALYERHTNDDPAGAPNWTAYAPLLLADYTCRAFDRFKIVMNTADPAYNPEISGASVTASFN